MMTLNNIVLRNLNVLIASGVLPSDSDGELAQAARRANNTPAGWREALKLTANKPQAASIRKAVEDAIAEHSSGAGKDKSGVQLVLVVGAAALAVVLLLRR